MEDETPRRSWLRLAIFLFAGAAVVVAIAPVVFYVMEGRRLAAGERPLADSTEAPLTGITLRLDRYITHPILAEYDRVLTVRRQGVPDVVTRLEPDTGGTALITVCDTTEGRILLSDRVSGYVIGVDGVARKLGTASVVQPMTDGSTTPMVTPEEKPPCLRTLGTFDQGNAPKGRFGYLAARP